MVSRVEQGTLSYTTTNVMFSDYESDFLNHVDNDIISVSCLLSKYVYSTDNDTECGHNDTDFDSWLCTRAVLVHQN